MKLETIDDVLKLNTLVGIQDKAKADPQGKTMDLLVKRLTQCGIRDKVEEIINGGSTDIPNNQIWYYGPQMYDMESVISNLPFPYAGPEILSNKFDGKKWVITFADSVTILGANISSEAGYPIFLGTDNEPGQQITKIQIPNSVTLIDYAAFGECTSLEEITIPINVTSITGDALYECNSLTSITLLPLTVVSLTNTSVVELQSLQYVFVPEDLVDAYRNTEEWRDYNIRPIGYVPVFYDINISATEHGVITTNKESAEDHTLITLYAEPAEGYAIDSVTVMCGSTVIECNKVAYNEYEFIMPAGNVTVSGEFIEEVPEYLKPLRFTNIGNDNATVSFNDNEMATPELYSKLNGTGEWSQLAYLDEITLAPGDYVEICGDNNVSITDGEGRFVVTGSSVKLSGCIMSLVHRELTPLNILTIPNDGEFSGLFNGNTSITDASELVLPATTLTDECYAHMFQNCTSLTTAPELPATNLAFYCYASMFEGCTSLTTAPELPATNLDEECYSYMFKDCTNLSYIKCLGVFDEESQLYYTDAWVNGIQTNDGIFVKNPNASYWTTGINGIPNNWTVQDAEIN